MLWVCLASDNCCKVKTVKGFGDRDGVYELLEHQVKVKGLQCEDGCVYTKPGQNERYCFR